MIINEDENPLYCTYKDGRVYSFTSNRFLKPFNTKGYLSVHLCKSGKVKTLLVHRLVALKYIPNPNRKLEVNHINGIKTDNSIENIEWATKKENHAHAVKTGLKAKGSDNGGAKLPYY